MDIAKLQRLAELTDKKKDLEAQLEETKDEIATLESVLIDDFEDEGVPKITVSTPNGNKTFYIRRDLWAKLGEGFEHQDGVEALKAAGFSDLVAEKYDSRTVSSFFRRREEAGEDVVPAELRGVFTTSETFKIGIRKA